MTSCITISENKSAVMAKKLRPTFGSPLVMNAGVERQNHTKHQQVLRRSKTYDSGSSVSIIEKLSGGTARIVDAMLQPHNGIQLPIRKSIFQARRVGLYGL